MFNFDCIRVLDLTATDDAEDVAIVEGVSVSPRSPGRITETVFRDGSVQATSKLSKHTSTPFNTCKSCRTPTWPAASGAAERSACGDGSDLAGHPICSPPPSPQDVPWAGFERGVGPGCVDQGQLNRRPGSLAPPDLSTRLASKAATCPPRRYGPIGGQDGAQLHRPRPQAVVWKVWNVLRIPCLPEAAPGTGDGCRR